MKTCILLFVALATLSACEGEDRAAGMFKFGPPEAEEEIKSAFDIKSELPDIDVLLEFAKRNSIDYEKPQDRSLRYCHEGRDSNDLSMIIFFFGARGGGEPGQKNYVAAYSRDRKVVCIETRHAYTSL